MLVIDVALAYTAVPLLRRRKKRSIVQRRVRVGVRGSNDFIRHVRRYDSKTRPRSAIHDIRYVAMYYLERPVPVQVHFAFALHFLRREESHRECTSESAELEGDLPRGLKNCFCGFAVSGGGVPFSRVGPVRPPPLRHSAVACTVEHFHYLLL